MAVVLAAQPDLTRQAVERASYIGAVEWVARSRNEEAGGLAAAQMTGTARLIVGQDVSSRSVDRHQPRLAELGAAHGEHTGVQVDIVKPQPQRLAHAQAGDAQQTQQCVVSPWPQTRTARQQKRLFEQPADLVVRIEVRPGTCRSIRQQAWRWNFGSRIGGDVMACKAAHKTQALCPVCRLRVARLLGPIQGQSRGDALGLLALHERREVHQRNARAMKLEAQASAQGQVVVDRLGQRLHCTPPGQGKAKACNEARSTLA